jgi:hypothetical protein
MKAWSMSCGRLKCRARSHQINHSYCSYHKNLFNLRERVISLLTSIEESANQ